MRKLGILIALSFIMSFGLQAQKIAVVDISALLESSDDYNNAQRQLDKISADWRQEISIQLDEIKSLYNKYQAEQVLLSEDIKKEREQEIMDKESAVREIQKRRFGPEGDLFKKRQDLVSPIQDKVFAAIEDFANSRGFDIIFDKGGAAGLLYANSEYDKTDEIKKKLGIK
jgi:outer membrane protein